MKAKSLPKFELKAFRELPRRVPSVVVLLLALTLTGVATFFSFEGVQTERHALLTDLADRLEDEISDRIKETSNLLAATNSLFKTVESVDKTQFATFLGGLEFEDRYPGTLGVGFSRIVPQGELGAHMSQMRREGVIGYAVWPPGRRAIHSSVVYMEPSNERNRRAIGFDMLTEKVRRRAMEQARDRGVPVLSGRVTLAQEHGEPHPQPGFVLYEATYRKGAALATEEQRRKAIIGFVFAPIRAGDFFNSISKSDRIGGTPIAFDVYDGEGAKGRDAIYSSINKQISLGDSADVRTFSVTVAGHQWTVVVSLLKPELASARNREPFEILFGGTIVSFFIFFLAQSARRYSLSKAASENQMRLVADMLPLLISRVDVDHRYTFNNRAYSEWYGRTPDELIGKHVSTVLPGVYEKILKPRLDRALQGEEVHYEMTLPHTKMGERMCQVSYIPERRADGKVVGVVITVADITEQRQFSERLKGERRISEKINEVGLSLRSEMDLDKLAQYISDVAVELTGAEICTLFYQIRDGGLGDLHFAVSGIDKSALDGVSLPSRSEILRQTLVDRKVVRMGDLSAQPDLEKNLSSPYFAQRFKIVSYMAVPVLSRSGEILGGLLFCHSEKNKFDEWAEKLATGVSAQAGVALESACLYAEAQAINQIKDEFLATLSHELRTPLNVILGYSELLVDSDLSQEQREFVATIRRNAEVQNQLIADLLDVSAIVSGKLSFHPERTAPRKFIQAAIDSLKFAARSKGVELMEEIGQDLKEVMADPTRLQQIIWNLLSNAVKFTGDSGRVMVKAYTSDSHLVIEVRDTGIGIEPEFLPYVFDRFRQEDSSRSRRFGGLGLGLSIVRQLVELHGGSIRAASEGKGCGALFTVRLPLAPPVSSEKDQLKNSDVSDAFSA